MPDMEKVICHFDDCLKAAKPGSQWLFVRKAIVEDAIVILKAQESEWLEDALPGQEYGTTWACRKCMHSIHRPYVWNPYNSGYKCCPNCGSKMVVKLE